MADGALCSGNLVVVLEFQRFGDVWVVNFEIYGLITGDHQQKEFISLTGLFGLSISHLSVR